MSEVTFRWESVEDILAAPNLTEMLQGHYEELCVEPETCRLDPDFDQYRALEKAGYLKIFAGRAEKLLVAYLVFIIKPHLHYKSTLFAVEDLFYISPELRRGGLGYRMFKEGEAAVAAYAKSLGWPSVRIMLHSKTHFAAERGGLGAFFKRLGYTHSDELWLKSVRT